MAECSKRGGTTSVEYAVVVSLLIGAAIAAVQVLGTCVHDGVTQASDAVRSSVVSAAGIPLTSGISLPPVGGSLAQSQGGDPAGDPPGEPGEPDDEPGTDP